MYHGAVVRTTTWGSWWARLVRRLELLLARDGHAAVVDALRARVRADASITAILVARVSPHGYFVEVEVEQRRSGELWWRSRSGEKDEFSPFEQHPRSGEFDLAAALPRLRQEALLLRAGLEDRGRQGRFGTLYLAVGGDVEWVVCRYPLLDELEDGTVRDLLWRLVQGCDAA
jgi:hypothetical protein